MGADGYAAAEVGHDEVEVFVAASLVGRKAAGDGALVEGVPGGDTGQQRRAAHAGHIVELVDHAGVGRKGAAAGDAGGQVGGHAAAQVAGMVAQGVLHLGEHHVVDLIDAALDGLEQTAAAHDGIKLQRDFVAAEHVEHQVAAKLKLVAHLGVAAQLLDRVGYTLGEQRIEIVVYGYLGRGRAGIYGQNLHRWVR